MYLKFADRVKETTTSTGTGNKALSGPVVGFRSFDAAAGLAPFCYEIHAVDAGGVPTGEWETGIGRVRSGDLESLLVLSSSAGGSAVDFAAGTKVVSLTVPGEFCQTIPRSSSNVTEFYVDTAYGGSGRDDNDGLSDTRPFATLAHAVSVVAREITGNAYINVIGDYWSQTKLPYRSAKSGICTINSGGMTRIAIGQPIVAEGSGDGWKFANIELGGNSGLIVDYGSAVTLGNGVGFSGTSGSQIIVRNGGLLTALSGYEILGGSGAGAHLDVDAGGLAKVAGEIQFAADCDYPAGFVRCHRGLGHIDIADATFTLNGHSVTGQRYNVNGNGVCWTNGGGATFLPGNAAGTETNGGKYL
jgi:hypothetical protein